MLVISRRPAGYRVGLVLACVCSLLYLVGFSSPNWTISTLVTVLRYSDGSSNVTDEARLTLSEDGHNGLWQACEGTVCGAISAQRGHPAWITAVQGMQIVGLLGFLASLVFALVVNFIKRHPNINNRYLEIMLILSAITGFIGSTVYAAKSSGDDILRMMPPPSHDQYVFSSHDDDYQEYVGKNALSWSYGINLVGCLLAVVSALVLCAYNRLEHADLQQQQQQQQHQHQQQQHPGAAAASSTAPVAVAFSAAGVNNDSSTVGTLVFLPPQHLAGGFRPPDPPAPAPSGSAEA